MAGLAQYHAKRDFRLTGEPRGEKGRSRGKTGGGIFVVQKHAEDLVRRATALAKGLAAPPEESRAKVELARRKRHGDAGRQRARGIPAGAFAQ